MDKAERGRAVANPVEQFYRADMRAVVLRMLVLASLMLMPFGMAAAPAAPVQQQRMSMTMPMEHCPGESGKSQSGGALATCTMVCSAALPAVAPTAIPAARIAREAVALAIAPALFGIELEIATPPPRLS